MQFGVSKLKRRLQRLVRAFTCPNTTLLEITCHCSIIILFFCSTRYFIVMPLTYMTCTLGRVGAQWLSGRVLDSRPKGRGLQPHRRHFVVSLSKNIKPSLVLVQPRKTRPFITERLLMGRKESNQTNKHWVEFVGLSLPDRLMNFYFAQANFCEKP